MAAITISCSSDSDGGSSSDELFMKFKVNGTQYNYGDDDVQTLQSLSTNVMVLGDDSDNFTTLSLWMPNNKTTGAHPIVDDLANLETTYQAHYGNADLSVDGTSGTMNITSITTEFIEGTFNFTGTDAETGDTYNVTEGSFRAYNIED